MTSLIRIIVLLSVTSCGSVNFAKVDPAEFGDPPPAEVLQGIADATLESRLIDPESRRVKWYDAQPLQAALWTGLIEDGWVYGWAMRFGLNSKNRMGGYTGEQLWYVMTSRKGSWVDVYRSDWFDINDGE